MSPEAYSILEHLGLPAQFGITLLLFCFILAVAPYVSGLDFGMLRVPQFPEPARRRLKWIGPLALLIAILVHVPFFGPAVVQPSGPPIAGKDLSPGPEEAAPEESASDKPEPEPVTPAPEDTSTAAQDLSPGSEPEEEQEPISHNKVSASIVESVNPLAPMQVKPFGGVKKKGVMTLVGLVTIEARTARIVPIVYYLEWVYITSEGETVLDSHKRNPKYKFTQRDDATMTYYWVNKRIWSDNKGIYTLRVYTRDFSGSYKLEAEAKIEV
ncbi:MAG: hypothetical protein ACE5IY_03290 [bacterium]